LQVGIGAELVAGQPHARAQALEALARLVDGRAEVLVGIALEPLDRYVELAAGDAPHSVRHPLASPEPKRALMVRGNCLYSGCTAVRSDPHAAGRKGEIACRLARAPTRGISCGEQS
jgi:hypothetical protein